MTRVSPAPENPLSAAARAIPVRTSERILLGSKIAGIAALVALFIDQSYDGTRGFTLLTAVLVAASLAPLRGTPGLLVAAGGAGLLLFAGSTLTYYGAGIAALICGIVASLAVMVLGIHRGQATWTAAAFVAGALLTAAAAVAVIAVTQR